MKILLYNHISCPNNLIMKKENSCMLSDQAAIKQKVIVAEWIKKNIYCFLGLLQNSCIYKGKCPSS